MQKEECPKRSTEVLIGLDEWEIAFRWGVWGKASWRMDLYTGSCVLWDWDLGSLGAGWEGEGIQFGGNSTSKDMETRGQALRMWVTEDSGVLWVVQKPEHSLPITAISGHLFSKMVGIFFQWYLAFMHVKTFLFVLCCELSSLLHLVL